MRLVTLREIPEDPRLRQQWNALAERVAQPQVFYTYEWALAVQRAYHASLVPLLFLAYDSQESLCGVAAFATDLAGAQVSFLCATTGDYCDILSAAELAAFVAAIFAEFKKQNLRHVRLANLPADSPTVGALRAAARECSFHLFARTGYICAQVSFRSLDRERGEKPETPRPKMVRRFLKAMSRENPVRLDHARTWDQIEAIMPDLMRAHIARFLVTGRISNMAYPQRRVFLEALAKLLAESGWLTLSRLVADDKTYAWNYGFQFQGTWLWYQPTFDSDWEKFSPGFCLLSKLIEQAAETPANHTVDLGLGDEEYKERFANQTRETLYVALERSSIAGLSERLRYWASTAIRNVPHLEPVVRGGIARLQRIREHSIHDGAISTLRWLGRRIGEYFGSGAEVFFYEWDGARSNGPGAYTLQALDLNFMADATAQYCDDPPTLGYLLRCAQRLRAGGCQGWTLVDPEGKFLHFAWTTAFDQFFLSELNSKVEAPVPDAVMIFDCWTPSVHRGRGFYERTIEMMARNICGKGSAPWIFSASTNGSSIRGVEKAGFRRRYSIVRRKFLAWQTVHGEPPALDCVKAA